MSYLNHMAHNPLPGGIQHIRKVFSIAVIGICYYILLLLLLMQSTRQRVIAKISPSPPTTRTMRTNFWGGQNFHLFHDNRLLSAAGRTLLTHTTDAIHPETTFVLLSMNAFQVRPIAPARRS